MTERNPKHDDTVTPGGKPSQAEGERRDTPESRRASETQVPPGKPSQAEGDRETIEESLEEK